MLEKIYCSCYTLIVKAVCELYKMCITEQSAQRQKELEKGLLKIMLQRRYEDITVSEICRLLNIPRKAFYRYFNSKDGALHALIDHTLIDSEQLPAINNADANAVNSLESFFLFWKSKRELLDALEKSGMSGVLIQRGINQAINESSFASYLKKGSDDEYRRIVSFAMSGIMTIVIAWHQSGYKESPEEMAVNAARLLTEPLFSIGLK